jgi:multiple sugar transport system substrate-binding protein
MTTIGRMHITVTGPVPEAGTEIRVNYDKRAAASTWMRQRNAITVVGAIAALAAAAAGCGSSAPPASGGSGGSGKTVNITFWSSSTQSEIKWLDSHFNATHHGIHVQGQYVASADDTTAKEVAAIKSNTEPNVVIGQDPSALPLLAESGKIVDLRRPLAAETATLYPGIKSALFYQGKQLGLALGGVGDYVLFYNKKDFRQAGISAPPATWSQLESDAIKLSDPAKHHYGFYVPLGSSEWISYDWESMLWSNGGQFLNSQGNVGFDSPAGVAALTTWVNLVRRDHAAPTTSFAQAGSYDGAPAFASNAVAMIIEGPWALAPFNTAKIEYGVAQVPAGTAGHSATGIGIGVASVFHKSTAADSAAIQFVKWLGTPATGGYLTAVGQGLPSSPGQLSQPAVKAEIASQPTYQVFAAQLKSGQTRPTIPAYAAISQALSDQISAALSGKVTPAQALAKAAAAGNQAIATGAGS